MRVQHGVILDVDGTLVDSNDAHATAWVEALRAGGFAADFARVRGLIGMGGDKLLPEVTGLADDEPRAKAISRHRGEIFMRDHLPHVKAFPGARELLERLRHEGFRLVVASSAKEDELGPLLELVGARDLLEAETSQDDVKASKPDPDVVHAALGKLGIKPADAFMLGDTPYDLEAATRAGVGMVGFTCGGWSAAELAGCLAVYADPAELLAAFERSPFLLR